MPRLYHWYPQFHSDIASCRLHGVVTGHPTLRDAQLIHTSPILTLAQDPHNPEAVCIQTENTRYDCSMAHCDYGACRAFAKQAACCTRLPEGVASWLTRLESFAQQYEGARAQIPPPPTPAILLRLGNHQTYYFDSMELHLGDGCAVQRLTKAIPHTGMFQDSVLCQIGEEEGPWYYDLRYFPYCNGNLEFYCWETHDLPVYLENGGDNTLTIRVYNANYCLAPGQRLRVSAENADPMAQLSSTADLYGLEFVSPHESPTLQTEPREKGT